MALNKAKLIQDINQAFTTAKGKTTNPEAAFLSLASEIADAIDLFVKSGTVTGTTASGCTAGGNVGTCTGTMS